MAVFLIYIASRLINFMKYTITIITLLITLLFGCNNSTSNEETAVKSVNDSLLDQVMEGHDAAMSKTNKLSSIQQFVQRSIDSLDKLPANTKRQSGTFKIRLDSLSAMLANANAAMDRWMQEFNMDSAKNDQELRRKYLESEKEKIGKVREKMTDALKRADSLLKR